MTSDDFVDHKNKKLSRLVLLALSTMAPSPLLMDDIFKQEEEDEEIGKSADLSCDVSRTSSGK